MREYDFETIIDRRKTNSVKWDVKDGELPMWVADMDFKTAPEIIEAIEEKAHFGVFGYEEPGEEYFSAVSSWYSREHGISVNPDWMIFATGVVPAISSLVRRLTSVGDNVLVQAPVYDIFFNSIVNNGRHIVSSDLLFDRNRLEYRIDWHDLETKLSDPLTNMMILCNPHNPIGKIWSRSDLGKISDLCLKYSVKLVSDEIHGDVTFPEKKYNSLLCLESERLKNAVVLVSPSKAFNVASLHAATVIVPDENLKAQVSRGLNSEELAEPNLMALPASIAAYEKGGDWLHALQRRLLKNKLIVEEYISEQIPDVCLIDSEATYLLWIYCGDITENSSELAAEIRSETGLYLSSGSQYHGNGNLFLRMNIACPEAVLKDGLERLRKGIEIFKGRHN